MIKQLLFLIVTIINLIGNSQVSMVTDLRPGSAGSYPAYPTVYNGKLFFVSSSQNQSGSAIWSYDGTNFTEITGGQFTPSFVGWDALIEYKNELYFKGYLNNELQLWKCDDNSYYQVSNFAPHLSLGIRDFAVSHDKLYFSLYNDPDSVLFVQYDGIKFDTISELYVPAHIHYKVDYKDTLYLAARDSSTNGFNLWKYDGSNTSLVYDFSVNFGAPRHFVEFNNDLFFSAKWFNGGFGIGKYSSDSVNMVSSFPYAPEDLIVYKNAIYFIGNDFTHGRELWKFNGSASSLVYDIWSGQSNGFFSISSPSQFVIYNDILYFSANDGVNGVELWQHDGTSTTLVADINNSPGQGSNPSHFHVYDGTLYFSANDGVHGPELWKLSTNITNNKELIYDINAFKVYPNPFGNKLSILFNRPKNRELTVTTVNGKIIYNTQVSSINIEIPTENWEKGVYILYTKSDNNFSYKKIVK